VHEPEEDTAPEPRSGPVGRLLGSLDNLLATLLEIGSTRLELLGVEIQLEVRRVTTLLILMFVALFTGAVALMAAGVAVILVFWDTHRILAASLVTGCFVAIAVSVIAVLVYRIRNRPRFLDHTLAELETDGRRLRGSQ
jgi:uncharacterized membrane protein YqjE